MTISFDEYGLRLGYTSYQVAGISPVKLRGSPFMAPSSPSWPDGQAWELMSLGRTLLLASNRSI